MLLLKPLAWQQKKCVFHFPLAQVPLEWQVNYHQFIHYLLSHFPLSSWHTQVPTLLGEEEQWAEWEETAEEQLPGIDSE